jgi:hypothetical protein
MPHLDDGILHAYLDGALDALADAGALPDRMSAADVLVHLDACADCRSRLEIERAIRERAGLVLRDAAPRRIVVPPLAAADAPARPARRTATWVPMAWAASLVLAVGAGWWGSQIARDPRTLAESAAPLSAPQAAPAADAAAADAPLSEVPQQTSADADGVAAPQTLESVAPQRAAGTTARVGVAPETGAASAARREEQPVAAAAAPPPAPAPAPPPAVADSRAADRAAALESVTSVPQVRPGQALGFAAVPERSATAADVLQRDSEGLIAWRAATTADRAQLGALLVGVSDAEVLSAEVGVEVGRALARVRQRLASGDTVEILAWRDAVLQLDALVVTKADEPNRLAARDSARRDSAANRARAAEAQAAAAPPPPVTLAQALRRPGVSALPGLRLLSGRIEEGRHVVVLGADDGSYVVRFPASLDRATVIDRIGVLEPR